jgi:hypothetical protein
MCVCVSHFHVSCSCLSWFFCLCVDWKVGVQGLQVGVHECIFACTLDAHHTSNKYVMSMSFPLQLAFLHELTSPQKCFKLLKLLCKIGARVNVFVLFLSISSTDTLYVL